MSNLPPQFKTVSAHDGGDGSTFFSVEFTDGTEWSWGPDIPYSDFYGKLPDGSNATGVFAQISQEHGERIMMGREDSNYNELPPIVAEGY